MESNIVQLASKRKKYRFYVAMENLENFAEKHNPLLLNPWLLIYDCPDWDITYIETEFRKIVFSVNPEIRYAEFCQNREKTV